MTGMYLNKNNKLKNVAHNIELGQILETHGGHALDQFHFFEVVELKSKKTVVLRELQQSLVVNGPTDNPTLCGGSSPMLGHYRNKPEITRRINKYDKFLVSKDHWGRAWNGVPSAWCEYRQHLTANK